MFEKVTLQLTIHRNIHISSSIEQNLLYKIYVLVFFSTRILERRRVKTVFHQSIFLNLSVKSNYFALINRSKLLKMFRICRAFNGEYFGVKFLNSELYFYEHRSEIIEASNYFSLMIILHKKCIFSTKMKLITA